MCAVQSAGCCGHSAPRLRRRWRQSRGRQAEAVERVRAELPFQERNGIVGGEDPLLKAGFGADAVDLRFHFSGSSGRRSAEASSSSLGCGLRQFVDAERPAAWPGELRGAEVAGGEIEQGQGRAFAGRTCEAREVIVAFGARAGSIAVPGVRTRVTSRRTIFLVSLGSSICSQMATR